MSDGGDKSRPRGLALTIPPDLLGDEREADLVEWLHADGARVEQGAALAELSTAKVVVRIEAPRSGRIRHLVGAGALVTVDTVLGLIEDD